MGRGWGVWGWRKLFLREGRESLELGSDSRHIAPAGPPILAFPGTMRAPLCQAPCGPHLSALGTAGCPSRIAPERPCTFVSHHTGPRAPPAARRQGWDKPPAAKGSSGCTVRLGEASTTPRSQAVQTILALRRGLASREEAGGLAATPPPGLGCGRTRDAVGPPGSQARPGHSRHLRCPQSWQPAPRSAAAERAPATASVPGRRGRAGARAYGPQGAKPKADESARSGTPARGTARAGRRAACPRGRARGAAGRGAEAEATIRGTAPPAARARRRGPRCAAEGSRGGAAPVTCPQRKHGRGPGRPCWYSGHSRSLISPRNWGRPGRCTSRPWAGSPPGCGAVGACRSPRPSPPLRRSPGPPPRPDQSGRGGGRGNALSGTGPPAPPRQKT